MLSFINQILPIFMVAISNGVRDKLKNKKNINLNALHFVCSEICVYFFIILSLTLLKLGIPIIMVYSVIFSCSVS